MGLLKKIADYISKANNAITDFAQDLNTVRSGYKTEFATVSGNIRDIQQRVDSVGEMQVGEFVKQGLYELDDIKDSAIKTTVESYNNLKNVTLSFLNKRKEKFDNWKQKRKRTEIPVQEKKDTIDDIIKKDEVDRIKGTYSSETKTEERKPNVNYKDLNKSVEINKPKLTYDLSNSYKTNMTNILKTYDKSVSGLAETLSGNKKEDDKKIWKWTDRLKSFESQLNKDTYSNNDLEGLEHIKQTITANKYLQRKHSDIAKEILDKLDDVIKKYQ